MTVDLLPAIQRPPHDPYSWVLNSQAGWLIDHSESVKASPVSGDLCMSPVAGSGRILSEPSGSYGGLKLPTNMALGKHCELYLLDQQSLLVKRFDPCECRFDVIPATGGQGSQPRQFNAPASIEIGHDTLYLCDTGNHRIQLFALPGFSLRNIWNSPAGLSLEWQPVDIVKAANGDVLVADQANNAIHRLNGFGQVLNSFSGFGTPLSIALDLSGNLNVLPKSSEQIWIIDLVSGETVGTANSPEQLAGQFCPPPFPVGAEGDLRLEKLCLQPSHPALFDLNGNAQLQPSPDSQVIYPSTAVYICKALDSEIYQCQWDKLIIEGTVPRGSRVKIYSYTAQTRQPMAMITAMPDQNWSRPHTLVHSDLSDKQSWDGLIRSSEGRYLWLKVVFESDGIVSPFVHSIKLVFPRVSLRRYLPGVFGAEPVSADFMDRFLGIFDQVGRSVESQIDHQARLFDPDSAPAESGKSDFLGWLSNWIGVSLQQHWPLWRRRAYLKKASDLFRLRGTVPGLRRQLYVYLGIDRLHDLKKTCPQCGPCTTKPERQWLPPPMILEHFKLRRWLFLGSGRLGDQAMLWGQKIVNRTQLGGDQVDGNGQLGVSQLKVEQDPLRDPFHVYAHKFSVFVPGWLKRKPEQKRGLDRLLETERPAHTEFQMVYVDPRFRIGIQSMIGFDAVVACYQTGYFLDKQTDPADHTVTALGKGTILNSRGNTDQTDNQQIGKSTRLQ